MRQEIRAEIRQETRGEIRRQESVKKFVVENSSSRIRSRNYPSKILRQKIVAEILRQQFFVKNS